MLKKDLLNFGVMILGAQIKLSTNRRYLPYSGAECKALESWFTSVVTGVRLVLSETQWFSLSNV